jgi:hypothetical protein
MATQLIQIVSFVGVGAGATVALPHQINVNDVPEAPDFVAPDAPGFSIAVTNAQVSVTNHNTGPASVNVWLELKHSIPRQLGRAPTGLTTPSLTPRPFIASGGAAAGGSVVTDKSLAGAGTVGSPLKEAEPKQFAEWWEDFIDLTSTRMLNAGTVAIVAPDAMGTFGMAQAAVTEPAQLDLWIGGPVASGGQNKLYLDPTFVGEVVHEWRAMFDQTPDGVTDYDGQIGSGVNFNFRCGFGNFGDSNWHVTGTGSFHDTGVAVAANVWTVFRIEINSAASTVEFFIDGVSVRSESFVPDSPMAVGELFVAPNTPPGSTRVVNVDYAWTRAFLTR